jgi:hypothetical protein
MTHRMILMSHDFKEVHKIVVARRKDEQDCRVSLDGKTADSYSADSDSISLPGSTFDEPIERLAEID